MYLRQAIIENSGPIRRLDLNLGFKPDGLPKPLVLVGSNGGGKTNFLSLVTDALFEAAAIYYDNVLPADVNGRTWFRVVGGHTTSIGAAGGFTLLDFEHDGERIIYKEKAGNVDRLVAAGTVDADLRQHLDWPTDGPFKKFDISDEKSRLIFKEEVHAYFPSSRSEIPYWLNRESIPETEFDISTAFAKKLRKPIYVEKSLQGFKQWLISVIVDSRMHIKRTATAERQLEVLGPVDEALQSAEVLKLSNTILRKVLDDEHVRFVWLGRKSPDKLAVARGNDIILPNLDALSGGQSILLGLFGTLLRYADSSIEKTALDLSAVKGICVIDEIDAHIHVELQHKVLPSLIALFPRIQFIVSSHSPLFVLGMQKVFSGDGFQLVEMPSGKIVTSERYSEFGKAMEVLAATEAFNAKLLSETSKSGIPIVFVEGETDAPYLCRAAKVLGREKLLQRCEIQWIGAKDESGQGFHTGNKALDHTLAFMRANPKLVNRPVLLLYDNDANKEDADYDTVSVRGIPANSSNSKVEHGIENLLSEDSITDSDYQSKNSKKKNGDIHIQRTLQKQNLCKRMCESGSAEDFAAFKTVLDIIENYLDSRAGSTTEVEGRAP